MQSLFCLTRNLILHEPPLVKDYANIKRFIEHPLPLNYPNYTQAVERAVKVTTAASGQIAGQKRQMGEALCTYYQTKKMMGWKKIIMLPKRLRTDQCSNGNIGITL